MTNNNDTGAGSLRDVVTNAAFGDTINFNVAVTGVITLNGPISITKNLTINGPGAQMLAISGGGQTRLFNITAGNSVTINGLTFRDGAAIGAQGVDSNLAPGGGKPGLGGAIDNAGTLTLVDSSFQNNQARGGDGGANVSSGVNAGGGGGAGIGGAIYNRSGATLNVSGCAFSGNTARGGNGRDSTNGGAGGGGLGGAIFSEGVASISNCSFSSNSATGGNGGTSGGGGGSGTGANGGFGEGGGGGIVGGAGGFGGGGGSGASTSGIGGNGGVGGGAGCAVTNGTPGLGGADAFIGGGGGGGLGGAVFSHTGSNVTLINCTLSGNTAVGGTTASFPAPAPPAPPGQGIGGGICVYGGTTSLKNNIVFSNTGNTGPDVYGTVTSNNKNIIGNTAGSTGFSALNDFLNTDPKIFPFGSYGGPTFTFALKNGSQAINAADPVGVPPFDQRGFGRVGNPDIGAFERQANEAPTATPDSYSVNEDNDLNGSSVLTNDLDVDGDTMSAVVVVPPQFAAPGTFTLNSDGTFFYRPIANFNGTDSFTYKAVANMQDSNVVSVTITVNPVKDTVFWSGGGNSPVWSDPLNWNIGFVPSPGDDLVFPSRGLGLTVTNDLPAGITYGTLSFSGFTPPSGSPVNYLLKGNSIKLSGGLIQCDSGGLQEIYVPITFVTTSPQIITSSASIKFYSAASVNNSGLITTFNAGSGTSIEMSQVTGSGGVIKNGPGTLIFGSANNYGGSTTVNAGTLQLTSPTSFAVPHNLVIGDGTNAALVECVTNKVIESTAAVTINNNGQLTLKTPSGSGQFTETIASLGGSGAVSIESNVTLQISGTSNTTYAGVISGQGGLTRGGTGTLTLTGANSYSGVTTITSGKIVSGASEVISDSSPVMLNGSGTLQITAVETLGQINGTGSLVVDNEVRIGADDSDSMFQGVISGAGKLTKVGTGTLTLGGPNSYLGSTTINDGVLQNSSPARIPDTSQVTVNTPGILQVSSAETVAGLNGNGSVTGAATLTVGFGNASSSFSGDITTIGLTKIGTGTLVVSGSISPTPATAVTVSGGTLQLGASDVISDFTPVTISGGATLDLFGFDETIGSIAGAGSIQLINGAAASTLTVGLDETSTTFSGMILSTVAGTLDKQGQGTLTVSGKVQSSTLLTSGSIKLGASTVFNGSNLDIAAGAIFDLNDNFDKIGVLLGSGRVNLGNGTMEVNGGPGSFAGSINGTGDVLISGDLTLSGRNTYTGPTTISGTLTIGANEVLSDDTAVVLTSGTLVVPGTSVETIASIAGSGSVDLDGDLLAGNNNRSTTFAGGISGTGSFIKEGTGTLSFDSPSVVDVSDVQITAGTLKLRKSNVFSTVGFVGIDAGGTLNLNNYDESLKTIAGDGTINFGTGSSNQLTITPSSDCDFSGTISGVDGNDTLIKGGASTLTLSGISSFGGLVNVSAGRVHLIGSLPVNGQLNVASSAVLSGTGIVGNITNAGTVDPGSVAAGTLNSTTVDLTNSTLNINVVTSNGNDAADRLKLTGAATIGPNSVLQVDLSAYTSGQNRIFTVLTAESINGSFSTINPINNTLGKTVIVVYTQQSVVLSVGNAPPVVDLNGNQPGTTFNSSFTEGAGPVPIVRDTATVFDAETPEIAGMTIQITNLLDGIAESLQVNVSGSITSSYDNQTGTLTLSGIDTYQRYESVLRSLRYNNTSQNPSTTTRVVNVSATDGTLTSSPVVANVTIVSVNSPPVVDLNGVVSGVNSTATFTEDGGAVALAPSLVIQDVEGDMITSAVVTLTNPLDGTAESLSGVSTPEITVGAYNSGTGQLDLTGTTTIANYQALLRTIAYDNSSQNPDTTQRIVSFQVKDTSNSLVSNVLLTVVSVNDAPSFIKGIDQTVVEDSGAQTVTGWATNISTGPAAESAQTVTFNLTTNNDALFAQLPQVSPAGDLSYTPAGDVTGSATVSVTMTDSGGATTAAQTFIITVLDAADQFVVTNTFNSGAGSLRDCLERARNGDTITFDQNVFDLTNADAATVINVVDTELPPLDDGNVTIDASDRRVTINGTGVGTASGIVISSSNNVIRGLNIVGFSKSGISIVTGSNNQIGGNRTTGTGPNGQGLRIGNCGAFAIELSGTLTTGNVVKGCWMGLDASGVGAQPNLAGVLIQSGATQNIIGGTTSGESNVISGNTFEGVTITGTGTDDNTIIGNIVGSAAVTSAFASRSATAASRDDLIIGRASVGNGTAGIFLSKGTNGSRVGGESTGEGNGIANNGGNGIEVRAQVSRKNSARSNGISKNRRGGIALFDGSNDGIVPPTFVSVSSRTAASAAGSRSNLDTLIIGRAPAGSGKVEIFADPEDQGSRFVGRATVVNGDWTVEGTVTDLENITATFTDDNGNTSSFAFFGRAPAGSGDTLTDTDGDGTPDSLETALGTDPLVAGDGATSQGTVTALKLQIGLNFKLTGKDSIKGTFSLMLPTGFTIASSSVALQVNYATGSITLDERGRGLAQNFTAKLATKRGTTTTLLTFGVKNQDLKTGMSSAGLTDTTTATAGVNATIPFAVVLSSGASKFLYTGSTIVLYKAKQGKTGRAKK